VKFGARKFNQLPKLKVFRKFLGQLPGVANRLRILLLLHPSAQLLFAFGEALIPSLLLLTL